MWERETGSHFWQLRELKGLPGIDLGGSLGGRSVFILGRLFWEERLKNPWSGQKGVCKIEVYFVWGRRLGLTI